MTCPTGFVNVTVLSSRRWPRSWMEEFLGDPEILGCQKIWPEKKAFDAEQSMLFKLAWSIWDLLSKKSNFVDRDLELYALRLAKEGKSVDCDEVDRYLSAARPPIIIQKFRTQVSTKGPVEKSQPKDVGCELSSIGFSFLLGNGSKVFIAANDLNSVFSSVPEGHVFDVAIKGLMWSLANDMFSRVDISSPIGARAYFLKVLKSRYDQLEQTEKKEIKRAVRSQKKEGRSTQINFRCSSKFKKLARDVADWEGVSIADVMEEALRSHAARVGYISSKVNSDQSLTETDTTASMGG